jgi:lipopolysaccharide heptosyltransferase I
MSRACRAPLQSYPAQRIAIIKPSALGDIIHALPVLTAVRQRYPNAYIAWVVNRGYESLLGGHVDLDATLPFDRGAARGSIIRAAGQYYRFFQTIRRLDFDLVIDLQGLLRSGLMTAASGATRRVGLSSAREGAAWFYTDVLHVADFDAVHAVDRYWLVAEALGVGDTVKQFRVPVGEAESARASELLRNCPRPWMFFCAGSRWRTKRWPPEHFAILGRLAQAEAGGTAVFVGNQEEAPLAAAAAKLLTGPVLDLCGQTNLRQLAALLAKADVMISNDTGPLHLAAALGRPVVAPYTCTKVLLNGPYGFESAAVESRVWCQGSYLTRCKRLECMTELTPERLWPTLHEILRRCQQSSLSA